MPKITTKILGGASGKTGNLVFRQMNGETFFSTRPDHYKPTKSAKLKTARKNFAAATSFAKIINSLPLLKEIWLTAKIPGRLSFNRIIKFNRKAVKDGALTTANKITPDGLIFSLPSVNIQDNQLHLTLFLPTNYTLVFPLTLFIFFYFKNDNKSIFVEQAEIDAPSPDGNYNINQSLSVLTKSALKKDPHPLVYIAMAGVPQKRKIYWTSTIAVLV